MAKFIKINDFLSINIESVYSISKELDKQIILNDDAIQEWDDKFDKFMEEMKKYPAPALEISPGILYQPGVSRYGELQNELYYSKFKEVVIKELGPKPEPEYENVYKFVLLLNNGTKVNIDKVIYDRLMEYVEE